MLTIEQTVTVSHDHRIFVDLPSEFPIGKAKLELICTPLTNTLEKKKSEKIQLTKSMIDEMLQGDDLRSLTGILHTNMTADEIRTERLKKHDCIN